MSTGLVGGEDRVLHLVDVVLDGLDDGQVLVDDAVGDRMHDGRRADGQLFGIGLQRRRGPRSAASARRAGR